MQARRFHENNSYLKLFLEFCFWLFSDFGRSIVVPLLWLMISTAALTFWFSAKTTTALTMDTFLSNAECTLSQGIPLLASSKSFLANGACQTFINTWAFALPAVYSIMCLVWIFLAGLGLRNQFRL